MTLSKSTRILLGAASLLLLISYFVPLWQIKLWAPQYPEGLTMKIWTDKLSGDIEVINGLNHYIGMKHISVEMFPEFQYIGMLIGFLIAVGLLAAALGSGRILFVFTLLSYVYGVAALWDFWRWGYDYGHNLDPNAAIKVPEMSYQPPVLGYKNLLNFTAYSGPDTGAWVIIAVCLLATVFWWREFFRIRALKRKTLGSVGKAALVFGLLASSQLIACSAGPEPIRYGKDECTHCKMTLTDKRYGAEIVTQKGRVFKFDDLNCLVSYLKDQNMDPGSLALMLGVDFQQNAHFIPLGQGYFLQNESLKSPMRADIACFSSSAELQAVKQQLGGGTELNWDGVKNLLK